MILPLTCPGSEVPGHVIADLELLSHQGYPYLTGGQPVVTAVSKSDGSIPRFKFALSFSRSSSPSHHDTKTVATPLPMMLVSARTSLMNLSTENTIAMPGTNAGFTTDSVAARVMKPAPVTPLAPFDVSMATTRIVNCWLNDRSTPSACAMNRVASVI